MFPAQFVHSKTIHSNQYNKLLKARNVTFTNFSAHLTDVSYRTRLMICSAVEFPNALVKRHLVFWRWRILHMPNSYTLFGSATYKDASIIGSLEAHFLSAIQSLYVCKYSSVCLSVCLSVSLSLSVSVYSENQSVWRVRSNAIEWQSTICVFRAQNDDGPKTPRHLTPGQPNCYQYQLLGV